MYFKKTVKYVGEPMSHLESIASSAVRPASITSFVLFFCLSISKSSPVFDYLQGIVLEVVYAMHELSEYIPHVM